MLVAGLGAVAFWLSQAELMLGAVNRVYGPYRDGWIPPPVVLSVSPTMHAMCCPTTDGKITSMLHGYRASTSSSMIAQRRAAWAGGGDVTSESDRRARRTVTGTLSRVDVLR